jgi:hypothetical protein
MKEYIRINSNLLINFWITADLIELRDLENLKNGFRKISNSK